MEAQIKSIAKEVENTFSKDDITNVPRSVLESLIIRIYDGLNTIIAEINETI